MNILEKIANYVGSDKQDSDELGDLVCRGRLENQYENSNSLVLDPNLTPEAKKMGFTRMSDYEFGENSIIVNLGLGLTSTIDSISGFIKNYLGVKK